MNDSSVKTQWTLVAVAIVLLLGQTLPWLGNRWVEDESWQCIPTYTLLTEGRIRNPTHAETDWEYTVCAKPVGQTLLLVPFFKWLGVGVRQARLPSVLFGAGLIILTYLLGRRLIDGNCGVLAAFLLATDNWAFLAARTARPDMYTAFFAAAAVLMYLRMRQTGSVRDGLLTGLAIGAVMNFHPNGVPVAASIGLFSLLEWRSRIFRQPPLWALALGVLSLVLPFWLWGHHTPQHAKAWHDTYHLTDSWSWAVRIAGERTRYSDFIGIANLRIPSVIPLPARAHIAAILLASLVVLFRKKRPVAIMISILLVAHMLWFVYLVNKTGRYFVSLAPFLAIAIAGMACMKYDRKIFHHLALGCALLVGLTQLTGNLILLQKSRDADYLEVASQLRSLIPPGKSVYAGGTFWMALYDHPFSSYHRVKFDYALAKRKPDYLVLNDRVMVKGMGWGIDDWKDLREQSNAYAQEHGKLAGRVSSRFYGDMDVYELSYP